MAAITVLLAPWLAARLRSVIDSTLTSHGAVGAPSTWVLGNHDVCRPASRYARDQHSVDPVGVNLRHFQARLGRSDPVS